MATKPDLIDWLLAGKPGLPGTIELELRERTAAFEEEQGHRLWLAARMSLLADDDELRRSRKRSAAGVARNEPELAYKVTRRGVVVEQGKGKTKARKVLRSRIRHVKAWLDAERHIGEPVDRKLRD